MENRFLFVCVLFCFSLFSCSKKEVNKTVASVTDGESFTGVALENGLVFTQRYLSDEELSRIDLPEITFDGYDTFGFACHLNGAYTTIPLNKLYPVKSKNFLVENDKNGRQWMHFFLDADETVELKDSGKIYTGKMRSKLFPRELKTLSGKNICEFNFILNSTNSEKYKTIIQNFLVQGNDSKITMMDFSVNTGKLYCMFPDLADNIDFAFASNDNMVNKKQVYLGDYKPGDEEHIKIELQDRKFTVTYKDHSITSAFSERIPADVKGYFSPGLIAHRTPDTFIELLITDYKVDYNL